MCSSSSSQQQGLPLLTPHSSPPRRTAIPSAAAESPFTRDSLGLKICDRFSVRQWEPPDHFLRTDRQGEARHDCCAMSEARDGPGGDKAGLLGQTFGGEGGRDLSFEVREKDFCTKRLERNSFASNSLAYTHRARRGVARVEQGRTARG